MLPQYKQPLLPLWPALKNIAQTQASNPITNSSNELDPADRPFHDWYRFVLSFPPHLVRDYLRDFNLNGNDLVLDPFCGTGTTLVEARLNQMRAIGIEANPFPHFASTVKVDWRIAPTELLAFIEEISEKSIQTLAAQGVDDFSLTADPKIPLRQLPVQAKQALIANSISPLPLHKSLILLEHLQQNRTSPACQYGLLALGNALVNHIGNLKFGPEVGVGKPKVDVPVVAVWKREAQKMVADLQTVQEREYPETAVYLGDARNVSQILAPRSVDAVITSPPYPNEKDYTRTTRLESVILGFFTDMAQLRLHKQRLLRSNTRGVYVVDDDDQWIAANPRIQKLAESIEQRRIALGKTSGFEKLYARVTRLYFGGMARHLAELTAVLKPGAQLAYVVGDQASYLQVLIKTGELLAEIATELGYEVQRIDLFRTRFATATQTELREEVIVLRWPG
ncbi:MAG: DNA methyltransferase [Chloroflexi bacterium]|nr:DNA methyltransferase [Ardenticatenaceae bacterium]MBL1131496.1 DNA methyltransferase [Chloroflexota bacterium]NOG37607.1 DNA methyltransferase [Chloroflexota bacterium]